MSSFFVDFQSYIAEHHPLLVEGAQALSPFLASPQVVHMPRTIEHEAETLINLLLAVRKEPQYRKEVEWKAGLGAALQSGEQTTLGCFDFYWTPEGLRLIEVNTNAAAWVLVELLRGYHGIVPPDFSPLCQVFQREWAQQFPTLALTHVAIVDEAPAQQKTRFEFLWIQALLHQQGIICEIFAPEDLRFDENRCALVDLDGTAWPFVYNRFCDFLLTTPAAADLDRAYKAGAVCLRPSPHEYAYLSDKTRLVQWSSPEWQASAGLSEAQRNLLSRGVPPVETMELEQIERLWAHRKDLFFKPANAYGGKSAYSGKGITRSVFLRMVEAHALAQPLFQPPVWTTADGTTFKYDLRIYVIGDRIVSMAARLFQGQLSNFQTLGGGFAPVCFS